MTLSKDEQDILNSLQPSDETDKFYEFETDLQREIIGLLMRDRMFIIQSDGLIKPKYFKNEIHKLTSEILFKFFEKYGNLPDKVQLKQEIQEKLSSKSLEERLRYFTEISACYEYYVPGVGTRDYLLDKITTFAKKQELRTAFLECARLINGSTDDAVWAKVNDRLQQAMRVDRNFDIGLEYFQDVSERYERRKALMETGDIFTMVFPSVNNSLQMGGLTRGEIGCWIGLSGTGKSLMLKCAAIANLNRGKKVLYVTLELDQDSLAERFDAELVDPTNQYNIEPSMLLDNQFVVEQAINDYVSEFEDKRLLVIKQFPGGTMDINMFRAYYSQLTLRGFKPDLVIIDYVGEMLDAPDIAVWESRFRILRDLRGLAVEEQFCGLSALQPNRSGRNAQEIGVIDDQNLGDAYGQIKPLDGCWSINQNDNEKACGLARIFVIKHRAGKSRFLFFASVDYRKLKFMEISEEEYSTRLTKYLHYKKERATTDTAKLLMEGSLDKIKEKDRKKLLDAAKEDNE